MSQKQLLFLQVIASFSMGAGLLFVIVLLNYFFSDFRLVYGATSYGPWTEEGLKFGAVLLLIRFAYLTPITIPFLGIGFGLMEATSRLVNNRAVFMLPFWVHIILGLVMAYFFYLAINQKYPSLRSIWYALALLLPVYLHLLYNIAVVH